MSAEFDAQLDSICIHNAERLLKYARTLHVFCASKRRKMTGLLVQKVSWTAMLVTDSPLEAL